MPQRTEIFPRNVIELASLIGPALIFTGLFEHPEAVLQGRVLIEGKGLSNEVNIRIFCYEPRDEMAVRHFIEQLSTDMTLGCQLRICNLYQIFLGICEGMDILDAIPDMEEEGGHDYLLEQLQSTIGVDEIVQKIQSEPFQPGEVLVLTGIGEAFPFMRIHTLLEASLFAERPVLVFYPGTFNDQQLRLFNCLKPNNYYRAFNVV